VQAIRPHLAGGGAWGQVAAAALIHLVRLLYDRILGSAAVPHYRHLVDCAKPV